MTDAEAFIEYVFGKIDYRGILRDRVTPPWPLEHHVRAMGLVNASTPREVLRDVLQQIENCDGTAQVNVDRAKRFLQG
jgi:hypothetical protein